MLILKLLPLAKRQQCYKILMLHEGVIIFSYFMCNHMFYNLCSFLPSAAHDGQNKCQKLTASKKYKIYGQMLDPNIPLSVSDSTGNLFITICLKSKVTEVLLCKIDNFHTSSVCCKWDKELIFSEEYYFPWLLML